MHGNVLSSPATSLQRSPLKTVDANVASSSSKSPVQTKRSVRDIAKQFEGHGAPPATAAATATATAATTRARAPSATSSALYPFSLATNAAAAAKSTVSRRVSTSVPAQLSSPVPSGPLTARASEYGASPASFLPP